MTDPNAVVPSMDGAPDAVDIDRLADAAEIGRVLVDAIGRAGPQGANREIRLALAADHDDRRRVAARGQFAQDLEPVEVRHHQVQQQHVVPAPFHRRECLPSGIDVVDRELALMTEIEPDHVRDLRIVLGVEHAHHGK